MREGKFLVLKQNSNKNLSQYLHQSCYKNECLRAGPILSCTLQLKNNNNNFLEVMTTGIEAQMSPVTHLMHTRIGALKLSDSGRIHLATCLTLT